VTDETEKPEVTESPQPPRRKYKRRPAPVRARIVDPAQRRDEFPGLTVWNCCDTCLPTRCVISAAGSGVCVHPAKAGLQAADAMNVAVLAKFQRAKLELAKQEAERKAKGHV
jgi:hypothetical protein